MTTPRGYFSEKTMQRLRTCNVTTSRLLLRSVKSMLACKLTLVYGQYSQMMDTRFLAMNENSETYEHAEVLADFLNQFAPWYHTSPSDFLHTQDERVDEAINIYKEYKHYLDLFKGDCFVPDIAERFCKMVYEADDYYFFKAFCNLNYSVYAEALLLYLYGITDYYVFVEQFQGISLFEGKRKPVNLSELKRFIRAMREIVDLYIVLM